MADKEIIRPPFENDYPGISIAGFRFFQQIAGYINSLFAGNGNFVQSGTGAITRTAQSKMREGFHVTDFGAKGDGVTNDSPSFSKAAKAYNAAILISGSETDIARCKSGIVHVPPGNYILTDLVDTGNIDITWQIDHGATISNYANLNGRVLKVGRKVNANTFGTTDYAAGISVRANPADLGDGAEVVGLTDPDDVATYLDRDSVAIYADNLGPAPTITKASGNYTATTATPSVAFSAAELKALRVGMIIDTAHSPKWSGFVTSWATDGTSITVANWYRVAGAGTPSNGVSFYVNPITKIWAHNANVQLTATSHAIQATGIEVGVLNNQSDPGTVGGNPQMWGVDSVSLGSHKGTYAFVCRGGWYYGFHSIGSDVGFVYVGNGTAFLAQDANGLNTFNINSSGNIEMGAVASSGTRYIDWHSSGNDIDYDARIQCSGGSGSSGQGTIAISTVLLTVGADIRPADDNLKNLGSAGNRWAVVYAGTGSINTSDERQKQQIKPIDDKVLKAWGKVNYSQFKFNDAVAKKGDKARVHFGLIAQQIKDAFDSEGLDPFDYGLFCYDEWDELPELKDEKGNVTQVGRKAGNAYGIRYDEALALECAYLRSMLIKK